jgi:uncharacterized protein
MTSNAVFLDTNGWLALLNEDDCLHSDATHGWKDVGRMRRPVVLTDWIIAETGNGLARTPARRRFVEVAVRMLNDSRVQVLPVTATLLERALLMYSDRPDKTWGLVDCASFVVMTDAGIEEAFTTDRHFEQAGFKCLLPVSGL